MKQGTLPGTVEDWASYWPKALPGTGQSVRSSEEAAQHITPWSQGTQEGRGEYGTERRKRMTNRHECGGEERR